MQTTYKIKNFKNFDKEGAEFKITPITILTGTNSAGKSSMVKSMMILSKYLLENRIAEPVRDLFSENELSKMVPVANVPMRFAENRTLKLGRFDAVLSDKCGENKYIEFGYSTDSLTLGSSVNVCLRFVADKDDTMNNGWLSMAQISTADGKVVYQCDLEGKELKITTFDSGFFKVRFAKCALYKAAVYMADRAASHETIGVDSTLGISQDDIDQAKRDLSNIETEVKQYLSASESALFRELKKEGITTIFEDISDILIGVQTLETGSLITSQNLNKLCKLSKEDAIEAVLNLPVDNSFDSSIVENVKTELIAALNAFSGSTFSEFFA